MHMYIYIQMYIYIDTDISLSLSLSLYIYIYICIYVDLSMYFKVPYIFIKTNVNKPLYTCLHLSRNVDGYPL